MRDYEKLLRALREADSLSMCGECGYKGDKKGPLFAKAADAIEELVSNADKFKWISTAERQPEKSGLYLTYHAKRGSMTMHYSANNKAWNAFDHENEPKYALEVTHWMPISEPPEVKK